MKVYLAGPITGHSYQEVTDWRDEAKSSLSNFGIRGYSPMRGKNYLTKEEKLQDSYKDHTMSSIDGINVRDFNDCKTADAILVNFTGTTRVSIGTCMEIAWARAFQIPCVIVMEEGSIHDHGMLTYGNILARSLEDGVDAIVQLLLP